MGKAAMIAAAVCAVTALAAVYASPGIRESLRLGSEGKARAALRGELADPDSAEFRRVTVADRRIPIVCGEVNSRNRFGGYVGFRRFIVTMDEYVRIEPVASADLSRFEDRWATDCRPFDQSEADIQRESE